ncbi:MAG: DUF3857 domain-containing protein [Breznakibacter sp.]
MHRLFIFLLLTICHVTGGFAQNATGCTVKNYQTRVEYDGTSLKTFKSIDLLVTDRKGDYYSKIQIPFSSTSPPKSLKAYISTASGSIIRELKSKEIIKKSDISDFSLYEDGLLHEFVLRHNVYPYIIHVEYVTTDSKYIDLCHWSPIYDTDLPTEIASLSLLVSPGTTIYIDEQNIGSHTKEVISGKTLYQWEATYKPFPKEDYSLHVHDLAPSVTASPTKFFYGVAGSLRSWKDFGIWYNNLHKEMGFLTLEEKEKADKTIVRCKNDREKIDSLYRFMQQTKRYVNVSVDIGGIKSYPAEYVCSNGYGDCKALSNYMKVLLASAGIRSNIVLIYADDVPYRLNPAIPSNQFNHVLLCVPMPADTVWLECTSSYYPAGYLGAATQNRYALLINEDGGELVKTPKLGTDACLVAKKVTLDAETGSAQIEIAFNGPHYEEIKGIQSLAPESWHERIIDNYLFSSFDADGWRFMSSDKNSPSINLNVNGGYPYASRITTGNLYFNIPGLPIPQLGKTEKRVSPVYFAYPINHSDTTVVVFPTGYKQLGTNAVIETSDSIARYKRTLELDGNTLKVIRNLTVPQGEYPSGDYEKIAAIFQSIRKTDKERILLIP